MFFIGLFSSQIAVLLIYLSIFLFFSFSILTSNFDSEVIGFNTSEEKIILFEASENSYQNSTINTIFEVLTEKTEAVNQTTNACYCKIIKTCNRLVASSNLTYHFETERYINSRPPPVFS